jgi:hypothetical protein
MLQVFYFSVTFVSVAIYICCKASIQNVSLFQTYVTSVLSGCCICCSCYTHMLQAYIANVSVVSDICCRSGSCCNISRCWKRAHAEAIFGLHLHAHQQAQGAQRMHWRTSMRGHSSCLRHVGTDVRAQLLHAGQQLPVGQA